LSAGREGVRVDALAIERKKSTLFFTSKEGPGGKKNKRGVKALYIVAENRTTTTSNVWDKFETKLGKPKKKR